jgi:hypothetical protein
MNLSVGAKVAVTDDNGRPHPATVTGSRKLFGPLRLYQIVVDDSGQELELMPEQLREVKQ